MGCLSYLCVNSGKAALSDSTNGSPCRLFLLKEGKVIEEMHGNYDSFGGVFDKNGDSFEWNLPWEDVCELAFSNDPGSGIALILDEYWDGKYPETASDPDPGQGWGDDLDNIGTFPIVKEPYHKVWDTPVGTTESDSFEIEEIPEGKVKESLERGIELIKESLENYSRKDKDHLSVCLQYLKEGL